MGPTPVLKNQKLFHTNQFFFIVLRRLHIVRVVVLISAADDTFWIFCRIANPTLYNSTSFSIPTITNSPVSSSARTSEWASGAASSSASTPPARTPGTGSASGSAPSSWPATPQPPTWDPLSNSKRGSPSSLSPSQDSYEIRPEIRL